MENDSRKKYIESVKGVRRKVAIQLGDAKNQIVQSTRTSMQNLALIIGTLVGGSFVLLSSPSVPKVFWLLIMGIVLLTFDIFWIFKYLFERVSAESDRVTALKKEVLDPLDQIVTLYMQAEKKEISWEEYDEKTRPLNESLKEQNRLGYSVDETARDYDRSNTSRDCIWMAGIGLLFICMSLLVPYIPLAIYMF